MRNLLRSAMERFRAWVLPSELKAMSADQVQALARDIGVTADDLYNLEPMRKSAAALLPERLAHEALDPRTVEAKWPTVWKDMQRVCSFCESKGVCKEDLRVQRSGDEWLHYCPNASTIRELQN